LGCSEARQGSNGRAPGTLGRFDAPIKGGIAMANWKCGNCGYELETDKPPEKCPSCKESCECLDNTCYTPDCQYDGKDDRIK
jgi:rubrerythrin